MGERTFSANPPQFPQALWLRVVSSLAKVNLVVGAEQQANGDGLQRVCIQTQSGLL
jgi:hypothetical protein